MTSSEDRGPAGPRTRRGRAGVRGRSRSATAAAVLALLALVTHPAAGAADLVPYGADGDDGAHRLHTALDAAFPAEGATLRRPVNEIRLRFTTEVQLSLSSIEVTGPDGPVAEGRAPEAVEGSGSAAIRLPLGAPLSAGTYTVEWRTAGPDSHPIQGTYTFRIRRGGIPGPRDTAAPARGDPSADTLSPGGEAPASDTLPAPAGGTAENAGAEEGPTAVGTAVRWFFFVSILGMVGPVAFRGLVLGPLGRDEELEVAVPRSVRGAWKIAGVAGVLGLLVLPARVWHQSVAVFAGDALHPENLGALLFRSSWGTGWLLEAGLVVLFLLGVGGARPDGRRVWGWLVMGLAAVGMCVVPGMSGHAWGAEGARTAALTADALHVLAAGVWMGGLGTLLLAGLPAVRAVGGREALPRLLPALVGAFSRTAMAAVALLVTSGLVSAWIHLQSPLQLFTTAYGRTLALKLAAVAGVMALGFYNWRVVRPSLEETPRPDLIRIPATVELVLGLLALVVAAALVATAPPG